MHAVSTKNESLVTSGARRSALLTLAFSTAAWIALWYWPHSSVLRPAFGRLSTSDSYIVTLVVSFITVAAFELAFLFVLVRRERVRDIKAFFKIERIDVRGIWLCLGVGLIVQTINAAFFWKLVLKPARDFLASRGIGGDLIGLGTGATVPVLTPTAALLLTVFLLLFWWIEVPEELFFRGYLQNRLQSLIGENKAVLVSAAVWDLAHLWGLVNVVERFLYGLVYSLVFRVRQNTTSTMFVHPLGNRSMLLAVAIPQIWGANVNPTSPIGIGLLLAIYVGLTASVIFGWKRLRLDSKRAGSSTATVELPQAKSLFTNAE